jgi:hypothetical protein
MSAPNLQNQDPLQAYRVALLANKREQASVDACKFFFALFLVFVLVVRSSSPSHM